VAEALLEGGGSRIRLSIAPAVTVEAPLGQPVGTVRQRLEELGLRVVVIGVTPPVAGLPLQTVVSSGPPNGTVVGRGETVYLTVFAERFTPPCRPWPLCLGERFERFEDSGLILGR
jgi:hypothetical protein